MTLPPPPVQVPGQSPLVRALRAPFELRTWKETIHLLLNLPVGIATFTIIVTGFATGLGMLITLLGIPIMFATMYVSRWMGGLERARARAFLDVEVPAPYRPDPQKDKWWRVHVARSTDPATWVEVAYHLLALPIGIFTFTVAVTFWATVLGLVTAPAYYWALPEPVYFFGSEAHHFFVVDQQDLGGSVHLWVSSSRSVRACICISRASAGETWKSPL